MRTILLTLLLVGCGTGDGAAAGGSPTTTIGVLQCVTPEDCPASIAPAGACEVIRCDRDGGVTAPDAGVRGCYLAPAPVGNDCAVGDAPGVCVAFAVPGEPVTYCCTSDC